MSDDEMQEARRTEVIAMLRAFSAADSGLGRLFAKQQGMHPSDAAAIVEILDAESHGAILTPARLAEHIGLTAGATSSLVNRLEEAGHVVRTREHHDRRVVELHSTPEIHAKAETFFTPVVDALHDTLAQCSDNELTTVTTVLTNLTTAITKAAATRC